MLDFFLDRVYRFSIIFTTMISIFKPKVPQKTAVFQPETPQMMPADYAKLAQDAGFDGYYAVHHEHVRQTKLFEFRKFLAENGICVYDAKKVRKYLWRLCPSGKSVVWCGLCGDLRNSKFGSIGGFTAQAYREGGGYAKPIPEVPLMTLARIRVEFPQAEGYVSDFVDVPKGDPFLAVRYEDEFFIIERWDEPGFRM